MRRLLAVAFLLALLVGCSPEWYIPPEGYNPPQPVNIITNGEVIHCQPVGATYVCW